MVVKLAIENDEDTTSPRFHHNNANQTLDSIITYRTYYTTKKAPKRAFF